MTKLIVPARFLLKVEYPRVQQERIEWESWSGACGSVPGIKRLTPLQVTLWSPTMMNEVGEQAGKIQERIFELLMGSEPFELVLAPGTLNEVRYPKVILTVVRPTTMPDFGPATEIECTILQVPGAQTASAIAPDQVDPKEDSVKIFEGVVVKLDEKKEPASVEQVVPPFVAETIQAAKETVTVDFATERSLKGKDLAGYSVRIREFQTPVL